MLIAATRYKITGKYRIDSGKFGPTEMRLVIAAILLVEILIPRSIIIFGSLATLMMLASDAIEFRRLLQAADRRDQAEKKELLATNVFDLARVAHREQRGPWRRQTPPQIEQELTLKS
jgi:hypothetical protein